ncbi:hypothetical protein BCR36DRAFT_343390 [Piromyces finnis]|uniref:Ubiquitin-like domain-containing protein n=1 Tax=Piromyces finnis TaxID=1754191 RepID=A0A1Y1VM26_9FUNG|nr:hypothetical protein BCR36DRAFT_343390 [Piromyces finnis]|eukprot:ORX59353.1 hypothetical protein BCR36DRAFT_343390 [Piromyces finnis]
MGNCLTKQEEENVRFETAASTGGGGTTQTNILKEGNKKLVPISTYSWKSDKPMTKDDVNKRREEFWLTSPNYNGRQEIWQALKAICETDSLELAQVIADSAGITIPTGKLTDGCYDELGNQYIVPNFCLIEPSNLVEKSSANDINQPLLANEEGGSQESLSVPLGNEKATTSTTAAIDHSTNHSANNKYYTKDEDGILITKLAMDAGGKTSLAKNGNGGSDGNNAMTTLRLSNNKDIKLIINKMDTIQQLIKIIEKSEELGDDKNNIRIIVKGKVLVKSSKLYDDLVQDGSISIVQVFISPKN